MYQYRSIYSQYVTKLQVYDLWNKIITLTMKRYVNGKLTEISEIVAPGGHLFTNGEVFVKSIPKD